MKNLKSKTIKLCIKAGSVIACLLCLGGTVNSQIIVNSATRWIDSHIDVTTGTLIQLAATGSVNAGSGLGSHGPEGILGPHTADFPTDEPYIYGLVCRLTNSTTNPDDELHEDWAYGSQSSYCSQSAGHLWFAVNDNNLADNSGSFSVTVTFSTCTIIDPTARRTILHVVNEMGQDVKDADIYINGVFRGISNNLGLLRLPAQNTGDQVIARKRILENSTYRNHHNSGSTGNWNYRVYNTSMTINNDGSFSNTVITEPNTTYTLTIRSSNTLIGLNWLASFEWDASEEEFNDLYNNVIKPASQRLFNATDGQFFVEQVSIVDNATYWEETDCRIFANWSLRANVNRRTGGFLYDNILFGGTWMNMSRTNWNYVYAHEFGHYGFDVLDEYADDSPVSCTMNIGSSTSPFGWTDENRQPTASCIMWNTAPKLCSTHPLNPHATNTRQGSQSCWDHLVQVYRDQIVPARYSFKTPVTRNQIMGNVPMIPVLDWQTRWEHTNSIRGSLCAPFEMIVRRQDNNAPMADIEVFNNTSYGQTILLGKTRQEDMSTPESEEGTIIVTGVHVGDVISASGGSFTVSGCGLVTGLTTNKNSSNSFNDSGKGSAYELFVSTPFKINISSVLKNLNSKLSFEIKSSVKLASAPQMNLILAGEAKPVQINLVWDGVKKVYVGSYVLDSKNIVATVKLIAKDTKGSETTKFQNILITSINPKEENEIFSSDGEFVVRIPQYTYSNERTISLYKNDINLPLLNDGDDIISGPYTVELSNNAKLNKSSNIRFQLPEIKNDLKSTDMNNGIDPYDLQSIQVLFYDSTTATWNVVKRRIVKGMSIITFSAKGKGTYVLTGRKKNKVSGFSMKAINKQEKTVSSTPALLVPNPAREYSVIKFNTTKSSKVQITVLDLNGKQIMEAANSIFPPGDNSVRLNTVPLMKGLYLVRISYDNSIQTLKLVID
jgi:hypothetical protein